MQQIQSHRDANEVKARRKSAMLSLLSQHMRLFGYTLTELPIIDSADLFLVKAGDQIINSLFTFDRQGKQLALRPEFTASAADYFTKTEGEAVARWQFAGSIFEDKSHEASAEYEQIGIGAELIGLGGDLADAEIIAMAATGLEKLGLRNIQVTIGHIGVIRELIRRFNLDTRTQRFLLHNIPFLNTPEKGEGWIIEQFDYQFGSRSSDSPVQDTVLHESGHGRSERAQTMGGRTQSDIANRMRLKQQRYADRINVVAAIRFLKKWCELSSEPSTTFSHLSSLLPDDRPIPQFTEWENVITLVKAHGVTSSTITIKPDLMRSWEYYTGIVFELHSEGIHLGGGGRYDGLARLVGSKLDTPSVGFTYYGDKLLDAIPEMTTEPEQNLIIVCDESNQETAVTWGKHLRDNNIASQILPSSTHVPYPSACIVVNDASSIQYAHTQYYFDDIALLVKDIRKTQS